MVCVYLHIQNQKHNSRTSFLMLALLVEYIFFWPPFYGLYSNHQFLHITLYNFSSLRDHRAFLRPRFGWLTNSKDLEQLLFTVLQSAICCCKDVTLKWLFYLHLYIWCHKSRYPTPPTCWRHLWRILLHNSPLLKKQCI